MKPCLTCGMRIRPTDWPEHSRIHLLMKQVPKDITAESYWRESISQEILGELLALDYEDRPVPPHYREGLEAAYSVARGQ